MRCLEYVIRTYARRNEKVKINTPQDIETAVDIAFKNFTNYTTILKDLYPSSLRKQLLGKVNESYQDTSLGDGKNIYDDKIRHVLSSEKYKNGFRYNSKLDMERFRAFYKNIIGEDCPNDLMPEHIANLGIVYNGMVYLPEAMLDSSACDKLEVYIEELFTSQNLISYKALFEHFQNNPGFQSIFNPEILKEYLKSTDAGKWKLCSDYLCPIDCSTDIRVEIKNAFANHPEPYSVDELCEQLPYLDKEKIVKTLRSQPCFLRDGRERYFLNTSFISDQNELSEIDVLLRKMLDNNEYVTTNELMDTLHRQHQRLFDNNSILSDIGIRNALSYHLRDFNFNGNLISYQGTDVNARRAFEQFALDHKEFTLEELKILATNFSSQINFDAIYKHALRVDETRFVSKEAIDFDTIKTDKAISLFCKQDYISITAIDTFTSFPSIMYYPWTPFLLESYLHQYSKEYNILQSSFCETRVVGAIAKKTCHYQNFNDILVNVVATAACPLTPNEVLQYLCDEGFLARKKYADINKIITQATNQRNKKG
jgi:hypothetical protein